MYEIVKASVTNIPLLVKYKLSTIFEYASNISLKEEKRIVDYVNNNVPINLNNYSLIVKDKVIIGCVLVTNFKDGVLLDEIYIEEFYRNRGIGSAIINNLLNQNNIIYLWVYKANEKAINLYKRLSFHVVDETESRYLMKYEIK